MRVISGAARGRRLEAKLPDGVRPTSDRVKEAMFSLLFSMGGVADWDVLDLFCGSGALGIEALSRGAASVTFVDAELRSIKAVEENLVRCDLGLASSERYRAQLPGWQSARHFDLALADPPYDFDQWPALLETVSAEVVIVESAREIEVPARYQTTKSRRYGTTLLTVLEPAETGNLP